MYCTSAFLPLRSASGRGREKGFQGLSEDGLIFLSYEQSMEGLEGLYSSIDLSFPSHTPGPLSHTTPTSFIPPLARTFSVTQAAIRGSASMFWRSGSP